MRTSILVVRACVEHARVCAAAGLTNPGDVHYTVRVACYKRVIAAGYWDDPSSVRPFARTVMASFRRVAVPGTTSQCALTYSSGAVGDGSEEFAMRMAALA